MPPTNQANLPYIYDPDELREICECVHLRNFKVFPSPQAVEESIHEAIRQFISGNKNSDDCGVVATGGYSISIFPKRRETGKYWVTFALSPCIFSRTR